jgi:hypothetical protein
MSLLLEPGARLVAATHNPGKARELADLLEGRFTVLSAAELGLPEPEEPTTPDRDHVVVHHIFPTAGSAALKAEAVPSLEHLAHEDARNIAFLGDFKRGLRLLGDD